MNHVTDNTATTSKTKSRRSSRPKASNQQEVSTVNPTSKEDTTMTTATAAEATFADVGDATGNTGTTEGNTPAGKAPEADKPKVNYLRVFVLATTAAGTHEFFTTMVGATDEEITGKKHLTKATRKASIEGYRWPMTAFDQTSAAARQLDVMAGRQLDAMNRS